MDLIPVIAAYEELPWAEQVVLDRAAARLMKEIPGLKTLDAIEILVVVGQLMVEEES